MLKTDKVIVVEGKYDAIRLANLVDAAILRTEGFGVFKDHEKQELLRTLAEKRGLLVLTDGDSAGMLIRNYIRGLVPAEQITDVYVPDLYGKEKRKDKPSKEGKLGVEGIPDDILIDALQKAGVTE
ncbi:MAG: toprim domain-containing protein, partial [Eubacteriales bacterium]